MVYLILDVPLLISLVNSFRDNFSEVFNEGSFKCKLIFFFVIKEIFITLRGFFYFEINYNPKGDNLHVIKLIIYISEIALTLNMMFVAYKNLQSDQEQGSVSSKSHRSSNMNMSNNLIRNSMLARRRVNSTVRIFNAPLIKDHMAQVFDPKPIDEEQSRWSISNASSDFNRVGLMGSPPNYKSIVSGQKEQGAIDKE